jgi:hypothetical protein
MHQQGLARFSGKSGGEWNPDKHPMCCLTEMLELSQKQAAENIATVA